MKIEDLPTKGQHYGSGGAITELNRIIDTIMAYEKQRCDCDSYSRCISCRMESEFRFRREAIKKRIQELVDKIAGNKNAKREDED